MLRPALGLVALALLAPAPALAGDPAPSGAERELVRLLNSERTAAGLGRVEISPALTDVADDYVAENERLGGISHDRDAPYTARANAAGCSKWNGPVLAVGYPTPRAVLDGWLGSPGHRAVLMDPEISHIGPGLRGSHALAFGMPCARNAANTSGDFGDPTAAVPPPAPPVAPRPAPAPPAAPRFALRSHRVGTRGRLIRVRLRVASGSAAVRIVARRRGRMVRSRRIRVSARPRAYRLAVRAPRAGRWRVRLRHGGRSVALGSVRVRSVTD